MNKNVTIIPSIVSLQKAIGTEKDTYKYFGIFSSIADLRKFEFLKSTMATYKIFEMFGNIYCKDYNSSLKSTFTQYIEKSQIDVIICSSQNDINVENIPIPIYCL